jgi:hypothetical protein
MLWRIAASGLWNLNHLFLRPDPAFLDVLERYVNVTRENDPHGEHDYLSFKHSNRTFFWKCDYYNKEMDGGSEDSADPEQTIRIGTLMLAEDY